MRPSTLKVRRWDDRTGDSREITILIEPHHPRFTASLSPSVKAALDEEGRYRLCEVLADKFGKAFEATEHDPVLACVGEDSYALFRDPRDPDKVRIQFI